MSSGKGEEWWWTLSPKETRRHQRWHPSLEGGSWGFHDSKPCSQLYFPNYLFSEFASSHSFSPWPPNKGPEAPLHSIHNGCLFALLRGLCAHVLESLSWILKSVLSRLLVSGEAEGMMGQRNGGMREAGGRGWGQGDSPLHWAHSAKAELCRRLFAKGNT